ncbi:MAG: flavodoxin family protein [Anaerovoracaceae bacterium]
MKKYILITGSPRKGANSDAICEKLKVQMESNGCQAQIFRLEDKSVNRCLACDYCKSHDGCIQKDDASTLIGELSECDGAVFIAPIYFGSIPGSCKVLTDRFYSLFNPAKGRVAADPSRKLGVVLTCGGSPEEAVRPVGEFVSTCFALAGFGDHKTLVFPGQNAKDAFSANEDYQKQTEELGKWLIE